MKMLLKVKKKLFQLNLLNAKQTFLDWKEFWSHAKFIISEDVAISSMYALAKLNLSPLLLYHALDTLKNSLIFTSIEDLNWINQIIDGLITYFPAKWDDKAHLRDIGLTLEG